MKHSKLLPLLLSIVIILFLSCNPNSQSTTVKQDDYTHKVYNKEYFDRSSIESLLKNPNVKGITISHVINNADSNGFYKMVITQTMSTVKKDSIDKTTVPSAISIESITRCPPDCN